MSLTGKLLIAPPNVRGNFWQKTVIFVTEDHDRGSIGLVLNKTTKMTIADFSAQHGVDSSVDGVIYVGGPVNVNALTVLHSPEWSCGNTMKINDEYSLSSSADLLARFAAGDRPIYWRMFAGLCAWATDQLEYELKGVQGYDHKFSWLVASASTINVYGLDGQSQWTAAIEQSSMEFAQNILA